MSTSLSFVSFTALVALLSACSGKVRPLNEYEPDGGDGGASFPGSGGASFAGSGGVSFGGSSMGGSAMGGASFAGSGGARPFPECSVRTATGCPANQVCIDDPTDDCNSNTGECSGVCKPTMRAARCGALLDLPRCPDGFQCVDDPRTKGFEDVPGICVEESLESCGPDTDGTCPTGFECMYERSCAPDGVSCMGPVTCPAIAGLCPNGYARSTPDGCFGPCVPIDTCGCTSNSECPTGSVCDPATARCAELAKNPCPSPQVMREVCATCGPVGGCAEVENRCLNTCERPEDCGDVETCFGGACVPFLGCI